MLHKPEGSSSIHEFMDTGCPLMRHRGEQQRGEEGVWFFLLGSHVPDILHYSKPRQEPRPGRKLGAETMQKLTSLLLYICYIWVHVEVKRQLVGVSACLLSSGVPGVPQGHQACCPSTVHFKYAQESNIFHHRRHMQGKTHGQTPARLTEMHGKVVGTAQQVDGLPVCSEALVQCLVPQATQEQKFRVIPGSQTESEIT